MISRSRALLALLAGFVGLVGLIAFLVVRRGVDRSRTGERSPTQKPAGDLGAAERPKAPVHDAAVEAKSEPDDAPRGWTLRGRTVRQAGKSPDGGSALAGARVVVSIASPWPLGPPPRKPPPAFAPRETRSAPDGTFELKGLPPDTELLLEAAGAGAGYFVMRVTFPGSEGTPVRDAGAIGLETGFSVRVLVHDEANQPVQGAHVWLTHRSTLPEGFRGLVVAGNPRDLTPVRAGEYSIDRVPPREHLIRIEAAGYAAYSQGVQVQADLVHTVILTRGRRFSGRVLARGGEAVPGAEVRVDGSSLSGLRVTTDAGGRFTFDRFPSDRWSRLQVNAQGFCTAQRDVLEDISDIDVFLLREAVLSGRVIAATDASPIAGVRVGVATSRGQSRTAFAETDSSGRFAIRGLEPALVSLVAEHPDHVPAQSALFDLKESDRIDNVEFRLERGQKLSGRVHDLATGIAVAGAKVTVRQASGDVRNALERRTETDAGGKFEIRSLWDGPAVVDVHALPYRTKRVEIEIQTNQPAEIDVPLEHGGAILGHVLDANGAPIEGATLSIRVQHRGDDTGRKAGFLDPAEMLRPTTDARGEFRFLGLPLDCIYNVRAESAGYLSEVADSIRAGREDSAPPTEIQLRRGGRVRARIRDTAGKAVAAARVGVGHATLEADDLNRRPDFSDAEESISDTEGLATFGPLEPGRHWLLAEATGRAPPIPQVITLVEGETAEVDVVFPDGHKLEGRVLDDQGQPLEGATVALDGVDYSASAVCRADGAFAIEGVPDGSGFLKVEKSGWRLSPFRVELPSKPLSLRMEPLTLLRGVVEAPDGEPVRWATVSLAALRSHRSGEDFDSTETDPGGQFELHGAPGLCLLEVSYGPHPAWSQRLELQPRKTQSIRVRLELPSRIEGVAVDSATSEPVRGCHLLLVGEPGGGAEMQSFATITGAAGEITLTQLAPGRYSLFADDDSRPFAGALEGIVVQRGAVKQVRLQLTSSQGIRGYVTDDGLPASGINVILEPANGGTEHTVVTGACGRFEAIGLAAGLYDVRAVSGGRFSSPRRVQLESGKIAHVASELGNVELAEGSMAEVEIELGKVRLTGQVRRGGDPVAGVAVVIECASGAEVDNSDETSESGEYELWLDEPRDCELRVWSADGEKLLLRAIATIPPDTDEHRLDLDLDG